MSNDIFDNEILCNKCKKPMARELASKNGFNLRVLRCEKCNELIVHPVDKAEYEEFMRLKNKEFEVKMRMVGNSYAVSIPREIVDFMKEQESMIDNIVKMSFQEAGRLSLMFNTPEMQENEENPNMKSRTIEAKEYKVMKNNKPLIHIKQVFDSANPQNDKNIRLIKKPAEDEAEED